MTSVSQLTDHSHLSEGQHTFKSYLLFLSGLVLGHGLCGMEEKAAVQGRAWTQVGVSGLLLAFTTNQHVCPFVYKLREALLCGCLRVRWGQHERHIWSTLRGHGGPSLLRAYIPRTWDSDSWCPNLLSAASSNEPLGKCLSTSVLNSGA